MRRYVCQCGDPDCDAIPYTDDDREQTCSCCGGQGCEECGHTGAVPLASDPATDDTPDASPED